MWCSYKKFQNPKAQGWFPKSYIKITSETPPEAITKQTPAQKSMESPPVKSDNVSKEELSTAAPYDSNQLKSPEKHVTDGEWYVALYQFDAVEPYDLSLKVGDRILVIEAKDEWWKGICSGSTGMFLWLSYQKHEYHYINVGIFPANYVRRLTSGPIFNAFVSYDRPKRLARKYTLALAFERFLSFRSR